MKAVIDNDNDNSISIKNNNTNNNNTIKSATKREERKSLKFENRALEVINVPVRDRCYTASAGFKF